MASGGSLSVRVVSAERMVYSGEARSVSAPAWDGQLGILPGHAPMITLLGAGTLSLRGGESGDRSWFVAGGALKVEEGVVTVLSELALSGRPDGGVPAGIVPSFEDDDEDGA